MLDSLACPGTHPLDSHRNTTATRRWPPPPPFQTPAAGARALPAYNLTFNVKVSPGRGRHCCILSLGAGRDRRPARTACLPVAHCSTRLHWCSAALQLVVRWTLLFSCLASRALRAELWSKGRQPHRRQRSVLARHSSCQPGSIQPHVGALPGPAHTASCRLVIPRPGATGPLPGELRGRGSGLLAGRWLREQLNRSLSDGREELRPGC